MEDTLEPGKRLIIFDVQDTMTKETPEIWDALIKALKNNGYKTAVGTSAQYDEDWQKKTGLPAHKFDIILEEFPKSLPAAYALKVQVEQLKEKYSINVPDMVLIDDNIKNIHAAIKAGAQGIKYQTVAQVIQQLQEIRIL